MKYDRIIEARFMSRPNRFCAVAEIDGKQEVCHVKNTGRCRELLVQGAKIFLQKSTNSLRKTKYDVIAVMKGDRCINMDSVAPNKAVGEWLEKGGLIKNPTLIKSESTYKNSRFDFYVESEGKKSYIEVKGVTLEHDGVVSFPDAPTTRGVKHLHELMDCKKQGYDAYVVFVVQMKDVKYFTPNVKTHPEFALALKECNDAGVEIVCVDCEVSPDFMEIRDKVKVVL